MLELSLLRQRHTVLNVSCRVRLSSLLYCYYYYVYFFQLLISQSVFLLLVSLASLNVSRYGQSL